MKKSLCALLTAVLMLTIMLSTDVWAAAGTVTYTQANEIAEYCYQGYNEGVRGPVIITKGRLQKLFVNQEVYLVTLSGTEIVENQSTGYFTDLLVGFNLNNAYLKNVVNIITANIPKGSNLILAGHSLGGMVAQQVTANDTIKKNYNVLNTVTFGSPLISAGNREGTVKRLGDTSDVVPYLSATGSLTKEAWKIAGLQREDGGYGFSLVDAHVNSYLRDDLWGKYDVTGTWYGMAKLTLYPDTQTFYKSPTK